MNKTIIAIATVLQLAIVGSAYAAPKTTKAPAAVTKPADNMKPLATCADGQTMYSATGDHRGACSGHGGVVAWADGSPVKSHTAKTRYGK